MTLAPGANIAGRYTIEAQLGAGGMGTVYVAMHHALRTRVALKVLSGQLAMSPTAVRRFLREASIASRIDHPAIVKVLDAGEHDGTPFLAMELLEGESLGERLTRDRRLSLTHTLEIARPLLAALGELHRLGIIHRDIKPDNVFLRRRSDGVVFPKLLDFGIAKHLHDDPLTATGMVLGTPLYLPPEQARGARDADARSDIYAFGVLLFRCLAGTEPYDAGSLAEFLNRLFTEGPRPLDELAPSTPPEMIDLVHRCLAQDPGQRPQTAEALLAQLNRVPDRGRAPIAFAATAVAQHPTPPAHLTPGRTSPAPAPRPRPPSPPAPRSPAVQAAPIARTAPLAHAPVPTPAPPTHPAPTPPPPSPALASPAPSRGGRTVWVVAGASALAAALAVGGVAWAIRPAADPSADEIVSAEVPEPAPAPAVAESVGASAVPSGAEPTPPPPPSHEPPAPVRLTAEQFRALPRLEQVDRLRLLRDIIRQRHDALDDCSHRGSSFAWANIYFGVRPDGTVAPYDVQTNQEHALVGECVENALMSARLPARDSMVGAHWSYGRCTFLGVIQDLNRYQNERQECRQIDESAEGLISLVVEEDGHVSLSRLRIDSGGPERGQCFERVYRRFNFGAQPLRCYTDLPYL